MKMKKTKRKINFQIIMKISRIKGTKQELEFKLLQKVIMTQIISITVKVNKMEHLQQGQFYNALEMGKIMQMEVQALQEAANIIITKEEIVWLHHLFMMKIA